MKKRWLISVLLLALSAQAQEGEEPVQVLRQRLADRLSGKDEGGLKVGPREASRGRSKADAGGDAKAESRAGAAKKGDKGDKGGAHGHWGYAGDAGPEHWAQLSPEYRLCSAGSRQSPIDIRDGIAVDLERIGFDYRASRFAVLDNGHTIQVNVEPGNGLTIMGRRYELQQFHFHRPSEERINGRGYDMSVHLVHKDSEGRLAVVAVLLERGRDQPIVQTVWNNLPLERGDALQAQTMLDPAQLLPTDRGYFTYYGSLTTPPCSEGVLWMVMRQPVQASVQQLDIFQRLYPMNARPIQPTSGRLIKESMGAP